MNQSQAKNPVQICQGILEANRDYNIEHKILPSENRIGDRLLSRTPELKDAYVDLCTKLENYPKGVEVFLGLLLSTAAFWNPDKIADARAARLRLIEVNRQIAVQAGKLAELLDQRSELHNRSGFLSDTHYQMLDVVAAASSNNAMFEWNVKEPLETLLVRYDFKYWPTLGDCMRELAANAEAAEPEASDPLTAAATEASRASLTDFFKALFAAIDENSVRFGGFLPVAFLPSDSTLASLVNCALDLPPDGMIDTPYVKQLRQRLRGQTTRQKKTSK